MMTSRKVSIAGLTLATALILGTTSAFAASDSGTIVQTRTSVTAAATTTPADRVETNEETGALDFIIADSAEGPALNLDASKFVKMDDGTYRYTFDDGSTVAVVPEMTLENTQ